MAIQWFPGHMHEAHLEIQAAMPKTDVVIEVLDARIPFLSQNPMLAELRGNKPCLKVLTTSDLADEAMTLAWQEHLEQTPGVRVRTVPFVPGTFRITFAMTTNRLALRDFK